VTDSPISGTYTISNAPKGSHYRLSIKGARIAIGVEAALGIRSKVLAQEREREEVSEVGVTGNDHDLVGSPEFEEPAAVRGENACQAAIERPGPAFGERRARVIDISKSSRGCSTQVNAQGHPGKCVE
jgi:hypothetical protein